MTKILQGLRILPRWIILTIDLVILFGAISLGYLLRFNFDLTDINRDLYFQGAGVFLVCNSVAILLTQSYAGIIRFTSMQDGWRIVYTATIGVVLTLIANLVYLNFYVVSLIPLSVVIIGYMNAVIFLFAYRLSVKYIFFYYSNVTAKRHNIVIFGAGQFGQMTKHIIEQDGESPSKVIAFIDDDQRKIGKVIDGAKIFDVDKDTSLVFKLFKVHELIIAIEDISLERKNFVVDKCLQAGVKVRTVPPTKKWVKGELSINQIKEINIEDLLGRESINLRNESIFNEITGKSVLITGAAGSIGSEIVRQIALYNPATVIMLDQGETPLYEIENEIVKRKPEFNLETVIADVGNLERIERVFENFRPDYVFHAAAYKHVPMMEKNPSEAILCNVLGTKNLADTAMRYKAKKFVMISTDKAVNPTSIMGASKRIAEIYVQTLCLNMKEDDTKFITTRFGNVLGSNGSVIPLFKKQIASGGPITVTHPEMTRYFMTIPEACQLAIEAGVMGKGCEIFIFDMGKSVKILDLAKKMIQLSGMQLGKDIDIVFTGLRDGEKLFEELLNDKEQTLPTHHPKIMIGNIRKQNMKIAHDNILQLIELAYQKDEWDLVRLMKVIVPEFKSNYSKFETLDKKVETLSPHQNN